MICESSHILGIDLQNSDFNFLRKMNHENSLRRTQVRLIFLSKVEWMGVSQN